MASYRAEVYDNYDEEDYDDLDDSRYYAEDPFFKYYDLCDSYSPRRKSSKSSHKKNRRSRKARKRKEWHQLRRMVRSHSDHSVASCSQHEVTRCLSLIPPKSGVQVLDTQDICVICHECFEDSRCSVLACGHQNMHESCLQKHIRLSARDALGRVTCPECRAPICNGH